LAELEVATNNVGSHSFLDFSQKVRFKGSLMAQQNKIEYSLEEVLGWLKENDYKVTRPFTPRTSYSDEAPPAKLVKAAIVDTETTGIDQAAIQI